MHRLVGKMRRALAGFGLLTLFACSGGSCDGCGVKPIPGGYPIDERIGNAAQVRVTDNGLGFLENNAQTIAEIALEGPLEFEVSTDDGEECSGGSGCEDDGDICAEGGCFIRGRVDGLDLQPKSPNRLRAKLDLNLESLDMEGNRAPLKDACFDAQLGTLCCNADVDTNGGDRSYIGLVANVDFVEVTRPAREGYTKIEVSPGNGDSYLADGEGVQNDDFDLSGDFLCQADEVGFIKNEIREQINQQFGEQIQDAIDEQLCTTQGEYGCPNGTVPEDGSDDPDAKCMYEGTEECVPQLLGAHGQGDLGEAAFSEISPGTHAPGQFLMASGGDGEAVQKGMSLFMHGGFRGTDRDFMNSPAHDSCVPGPDEVPVPELPQVSRVQTFRSNAVPGAGDSAHLGVGISEKYLNYAGYHIFDSGMLCIGTSTRISQQLSSGLFSLLVSSLNNLTFPEDKSPLAVSLRPQRPPKFEVGDTQAGEPLLTVTLEQLAIDFYVWSTERYIRFMTFNGDVAIPVQLQVDGGELKPMLGEVTTSNATVTNSEMLQESPDMLVDVFQDVLGQLVGQLGGSISGFALPDFNGIGVNVGEGGIVGFEDGGEEFVGLFGSFEIDRGSALTAVADTNVELTDLQLDPKALKLETWGQGQRPSVHMWLEGQGRAGAEFEYSYRIDGGTWSQWSSRSHVVLEDPALMLQARHVIEARARIAGEPETADRTPARAELLIDVLAPRITTHRGSGSIEIRASDVITPKDELQYRYRTGGSSWTEWSALGSGARIAPDYADAEVEVEVRDEAGNVARTQAALIRGGPNPNNDGGCNCAASGDARGPGSGTLAVLGVLFALGLQRRRSRPRNRRGPRRHTALAAGLTVLLSLGGCSGGGGGGTDAGTDSGPSDPCGGSCTDPDRTTNEGTVCCPSTAMCVEYDLFEICEGNQICASPDAVETDDSCNPVCTDCADATELDPGMLATHLDADVDGEGSLVLSGYSPGKPPRTPLGDLVVGTVDPESPAQVDWTLVDGAPDQPIRHDPEGWRGGVSLPGDDVGRWTSIRAQEGTLYVGYYDRSAGALKLAIRNDGTWTTQGVEETGDAGQYGALALADGKPVLAYMQIVPPESAPGKPRARARVAHASSAMPGGADDWMRHTVREIAMDCRPGHCGEGQRCLEDGRCVMPSSDCSEECADDQVCAQGSCKTVLPDPYVEAMPPATGMYNALEPTENGLALAFYERATGNLRGARWDGASWSEPFLIDGYAKQNSDAGDSGMSASLAIDDGGVWHLAYVDGTEEAVRYARVDGSNIQTEMVDDGSTDGSERNPDGRHIVGDDSSIAVTSEGEVRIVYQDATAQRAMIARRPASSDAWSIEVLDDMDHTGFWLEQELNGNTSLVTTFWRNEQDRESGTRVLTVE